MEHWHVVIVFASGLAIGASVVSLGDKFLAWFFYLRLKKTQEELKEAEKKYQELLDWRMGDK